MWLVGGMGVCCGKGAGLVAGEANESGGGGAGVAGWVVVVVTTCDFWCCCKGLMGMLWLQGGEARVSEVSGYVVVSRRRGWSW